MIGTPESSYLDDDGIEHFPDVRMTIDWGMRPRAHMLFPLGAWFRRLRAWFPLFVARLLPRWLVTWAFIRVVAEATGSRWPGTDASSLFAMDALNRWMRGSHKSPRGGKYSLGGLAMHILVGAFLIVIVILIVGLTIAKDVGR